MTQPTPDPARGAEVVALDRAHVFHSWSAQGALEPAGRRRRRGLLRLGLRRHPLPRLLQPAGQRQHRPPAPEGRRRDPGAGRPARRRSRRSTPTTCAARPRKRIADLAPPGLNKVFFTNGGADANENAIRMARLHTGRHKVLSVLPLATTATPAPPIDGDRRPAPLAQRVRRRPRALLRPLPLPHAVLVAPPRRRSPSAPSHHLEQVIQFEGRRRSPRSCSRRSSARPASSSRRPATSRASARCATATASSGSPTRSCAASAAPGSGSPTSTSASTPT